MIQDLPIEVLQQIVSYLPSASAIINVSLVNRKLFNAISADDYTSIRQFVQNAFPSIKIPPLWKDATRVLTSRSRAWDRRAFVARECYPQLVDPFLPHRAERSQKFGYVPVIDSYECWPNSSWAERKEVLVWGAAGRLVLRVKENRSTKWKSLRRSNDSSAQQDILDVRLLRPHQKNNLDKEAVLLRRANNEVALVETAHEHNDFEQKSLFATGPEPIDCLDLSMTSEPILATCNIRSVQVYPVLRQEQCIEAIDKLYIEQKLSLKHRGRCLKFVSDDLIATSIQFVEGRERAPIRIYNIRPSGLSASPLVPSASISNSHHWVTGRHCANTLAPVADLSAIPGKLLLSGWSDGIARLYDLRMPLAPVAEYIDAVDDGQILSILPIGQERFLAGSFQNACLKTFDFRMPGARCYSYPDTRRKDLHRPNRPSHGHGSSTAHYDLPNSPSSKRDINIFLAMEIKLPKLLWSPLPTGLVTRFPRYRGPIYSLSSPSPSSPTVYAGIENHVIQLDFVSSDDVTSSVAGLNDPFLDLQDEKPEKILNLSCYERPRKGRESTDVVLLRNQIEWDTVKKMNLSRGGNRDVENHNISEEGWDERWRLASHDIPKDRSRTWRSVRGR